jgi:adenosylcobinamide-GDP ribazoletransferase
MSRFDLQSVRLQLAEAWRGYRQALCLLTRLPVRVDWESDLKWGTLTGWFPAVGGLIGLLLAAFTLAWGGVSLPYAPVSAALILIVWAGLTGGLHLDGWADCSDAFYTPVSRERRLEIMADPRLGAFGTMGLILLLLLKYAGLCVVMTKFATAAGAWHQVVSLWPLVVAPVAARAVMVAVLADARLPLAKPDGMGAKARDGLGMREVWRVAVTALVVAVAGGYTGVAMLLTAAAAGIGFAFFARQRIGGLTGDVLGAVVEVAETAALVALTLDLGEASY